MEVKVEKKLKREACWLAPSVFRTAFAQTRLPWQKRDHWAPIWKQIHGFQGRAFKRLQEFCNLPTVGHLCKGNYYTEKGAEQISLEAALPRISDSPGELRGWGEGRGGPCPRKTAAEKSVGALRLPEGRQSAFFLP